MSQIKRWNDVHGEPMQEEKMTAFLENANDQYAILQLRRCDETALERFMSLQYLTDQGMKPDIDHYEVVYVSDLPVFENTVDLLEGLYTKFNMDRPEDFTGHSLSVSDIVALQQNSAVNCYYVDSIGFKELPGFLKPENYLKNAEMAMEDDYSMLDGIVNNGKRDEAERLSVLEQLKDRAIAPAKPPMRDCPMEQER